MSIGFLKFNFSQSQVLTTVLFVLVTCCVSIMLFLPYIPYSIDLNIGERSPETILSPRVLEFESSVNEVHNQNYLQAIKDQHAPSYKIDPSINQNTRTQANGLFTDLFSYQSKSLSACPPSLDYLSPSLKTQLTSLPPKRLSTLRFILLDLLNQTLLQGLINIEPAQLKVQFSSELKNLDLAPFETEFITQTLLHIMIPNLVIDDLKTQMLLDQALARSVQERTVYKKDQPIIYQGDLVETYHIDAFKALNIFDQKTNFLKFIGIFMITLFSFFSFKQFLKLFYPVLYQQPKHLLLCYLLIILFLFINLGLLQLDHFSSYFDPSFLIPTPLIALLVCLLISPRVALIVSCLSTIFSCILFQAHFSLFYYLFFSACVTTFLTYKKYKRRDLIFAGNIIGLAHIFIILSLFFFQDQSIWWFFTHLVIGFLNGVLSVMICLAVLPYFESLFKLTTNQTLIELQDLNHPLLKQLMIKAPGTYQHSVMVAHLAEAGAEAIGANAILCRVGGYFHDIGKMKRPLFFSENQGPHDNPHHQLTPRISKMVIASHTKDGILMASAHKLPDILKDLMAQHHGTSMVSFFYHQAIATLPANEKDTAISKEEFRYSGPKPQFIESGILMLSDTIEAAIRSMTDLSLPKIEGMVHKIIQDKILDHQLSECPLTLQNIEQLEITFISILKGMYHNRLNYDDQIHHLLNKPTDASSD